MKRIFLITFGLFIAFNLFWYKSVEFECGIYLAYLQSILRDGDFNLANNLPETVAWMLSPTMNFPDMHDHGAALLWIPGGLLALLAEKLGFSYLQSSRGAESIWILFIFLSNALLILGAVLNLRRAFPEIVDDSKKNFLIGVSLFISPALFYFLGEFTSADLAALYLSSWILLTVRQSQLSMKDYLLLGILVGLTRVTKISIWFWLPYLLCEIFFKETSVKERFKATVTLALGIFGVLVIKEFNSALQFGSLSWATGYDYDFSLTPVNVWKSLWKNILGEYGILHQAPWLLFGFGLWIYNLKNLSEKKFWLHLALGSIILAKFGYEVFCVSDSETEYGFRRYLIDLPIFISVVMTSFGLTASEGKRRIQFALGILSFYNLYYFLWYNDMSVTYQYAFGVKYLWSFGSPLRFSGLTIQKLFQYLIEFNWLPLFAIMLAAVSIYEYVFRRFFDGFSFPKFSLSLLALYGACTVLNSIFNPIHVESMRNSGFLLNKVIASDFQAYLYDEITSELGRNLIIAKYKKDRVSYDEEILRLKNYIGKVPDQVLADPVGFKKDLKNGIYRKTSYEDSYQFSELLSFEAPTFYNRLLDSN